MMKGCENKPLEISSATISSLLGYWGNTVLTAHIATTAPEIVSEML